MPEEPTGNDDAIRRLERRIEALEYAAQGENRWWRGGLIAALVLIALSILIAGHHRHHHWQMGGCEGPPMAYGPPYGFQYGPSYGPQYGPTPPNWGNAPMPQGGGLHRFGPPPGLWQQHQQETAPAPEAPQPAPKQ